MFDSTRPVAPLVPVLTREIGHILGFKDTCGTWRGPRADPDCPPDELESVMLSGSNRDQLTGWDVDRLCARFPRNEATSAEGAKREPSGQVGASCGWWVMAAAAALTVALFFSGRVRRRGVR